MSNKKKILITGGTGYLGSRLVQSLSCDGHEIIVLKRLKTTIDTSKDIFKNVIFFNIEDGLDLPFKKNDSIDMVIHTATAYDNDINSHDEIDFVNWFFPSNLINIAILHGVKYFINTDTSLPKEINYYSLTKANFRQYGSELLNKNNINFINVKLEYIYGESMTSSNLPYYLIDSCLKNIWKINLSKGEQKRDFIHIDDVISGYKIIINNIDSNKQKYFEIGSGQSVTIRELAAFIKLACKSTSSLNFGHFPYRNNEIMESIANVSAIRNLGWAPKYSLEEGLKNVIIHEEKRFKLI